ncbi:MAG: MFS transporter [Alphaproteobacteria bacterium]|nr:MFS transporter [Alphaproteobacteria bacterium]
MAHAPSAPSNAPLLTQIQSFDRTFWITNFMEVLERFAYYGVRTVLPTYMVLSIAEGGPQFTHIDKGFIYAWWALVQAQLPMFTGGYADRYGYKNTIAVAIVLKIIGYLLMAHMMDFWGFFTGCMFLAAGTAVFKPGVQGILASVMKKEYASVGWGLFYQLVNIGGFLGPMLAGYLRLLDWVYVFYACAVIVSLNFLTLLMFEEPTRKNEKKDERSALSVLIESVVGVFRPRIFSFVVLFSGFWFMFNQIFDILPNFLDDWVDSTVLWHIWAGLPLPGSGMAADMAAKGEPFNQEWIINLNPGLIIFLMVPIAWLTNFTTPLRSILVGIFIASAGTLFIGGSTSVFLCVGAIFVFSLGEMCSSPKKMEYMASLAKPGEEGLFMGYANVPLAIGWGAGSLVGGWFYETFGDRTNLARHHLHTQLDVPQSVIDAIPKDDVLGVLGGLIHQTEAQTRDLLWTTYNPGQMWMLFAGIGLISLVGLAVYDIVLRRIDASA